MSIIGFRNKRLLVRAAALSRLLLIKRGVRTKTRRKGGRWILHLYIQKGLTFNIDEGQEDEQDAMAPRDCAAVLAT